MSTQQTHLSFLLDDLAAVLPKSVTPARRVAMLAKREPAKREPARRALVKRALVKRALARRALARRAATLVKRVPVRKA